MLKIALYSTALLVVTIAGDFCIKKAAMLRGLSGWPLLLAGGTINFVCAIGWFRIYRSQKFITVGGMLSIGLLVLSVLVSQFVLREKIGPREMLGVGLGFVSMAILLKSGNS